MHTTASVSLYDTAAALIVLAAALGYLNHRFLRLPQTVGLTVMGAIASLILVSGDRLLFGGGIAAMAVGFISGIDFQDALMNGMLSFLLFAGALHVDWSQMKQRRWPIVALSTIGVIISTVVVGCGFHLLTRFLNLPVPLLWCFVFGALISPTDPVSVMGILKRAKVSPELQATVAGESLFNDGIGIVVFTILFAAASGAEPFSLSHGATLFVVETGGGVLLGLAAGWTAFAAMRSIDEYNLEVLVSLAVVMGGYALARALHVSGPVAMAVSGLIIGNHGVKHAMSDTTRDYLLKFWSLIDDILNAVLFLLIGLEVVMIAPKAGLFLASGGAILIVLTARIVAVVLPLEAMRPFLRFGRVETTTLVWGGLRGGISIALALGLPDSTTRTVALTSTYAIVLFSVIVQAGTIERVIAWRAK